MISFRRLALVATPLVAMATLAVGLRAGATVSVHAAVVYGAPKARGSDTFAWQLVTMFEDGGVREVEPIHNIDVHARSGAHETAWHGHTNGDGVAEIRLDLPGVNEGDPLELSVYAEDYPEPFAIGRVAWSRETWPAKAPPPFVRASRREGALGIDVAVLGGRLVPSYNVPLAVRVTPAQGVTLTTDPDPGLDVLPKETSVACDNGWTRVEAVPVMGVATLSIHARDAGGRTGDWNGALPVAPGGMVATQESTRAIDDTMPFGVVVRAGAARMAYVELDDDVGRAFAWAAPLVASPLGPQARFDVPRVGAGVKWIVTSSEPRGAESLAASTLAWPMLVASDSREGPCAVLEELATHPAGGFHRFVALDGFAARAPELASRRRRGLTIALGSLAVASVLEVLLLLDAAARARAEARKIAQALANEAGAPATAPPSALWYVAVTILAALLGFGLLAALIVSRA